MSDDEAVRIATRADEDGVMKLTPLIHNEIARFSYDEGRVRETIRRALDKEMAILGVIGPPEDIKGAILMLLSPMWFSQDWHLEELFNFVRPDCRRSNYGLKLIRFAKDCADQIQIPLSIGIFNNVRVEAKIRMYRRELPEGGAFFFYEPQKAA